jgi:hypothetical protein
MNDDGIVPDEQLLEDNICQAIRHGLTSFRDAFQVTCRSSGQPHNQCGQCKACQVDSRILTTKVWWSHTGDLMKRRFLLALIYRLKFDLLNHLAQILKPFFNGKGDSSLFFSHL